MNKFIHIKKFISLLIIYALLIHSSGCYSTKTISGSDLPLPYSVKYSYIVHTGKQNYRLEKVTIINDTLSGRINSEKSPGTSDRIRLYLPSDSLLKVDSTDYVRIPLESFLKVEQKELSTSKTIALVILCIPVLIMGIGAIDLAINGFDMDLGL
jgi:hypothetical protein